MYFYNQLFKKLFEPLSKSTFDLGSNASLGRVCVRRLRRAHGGDPLRGNKQCAKLRPFPLRELPAGLIRTSASPQREKREMGTRQCVGLTALLLCTGEPLRGGENSCARTAQQDGKKETVNTSTFTE